MGVPSTRTFAQAVIQEDANLYIRQAGYVTKMWANAQRDGRPAEYRWRPLFNAAVWLTPTTTCRAVTLPRRETS